MRTIPSTSRRSAAVSVCLVLSAPVLVTYGHSPTSADVAGTVKAVASITRICDCITQLASGDVFSDFSFDHTGADDKIQRFGVDAVKAKSHLKFTCLLAPNASAHEHDMIMAQSKALSEVDPFFISDVDLEHFLDSAVDSTGFKGAMVVTSGIAGTADIGDLAAQRKKEEAKPYKADRGSARVEVAKWPSPSEEDENGPKFRFDSHVQTSPKNAVAQVINIGTALEKAAPDQTSVFCSHVDAYVVKLKKLDEWAASSLSSVPQDKRVLFTNHDVFDYFSKGFGVKLEGAALSDLNAQQDATADKIQQTVDKAKSSGAVAIFVKDSNNPKPIQKVVEATGVKAVIGDETLYGGPLGTPGSDGETYIGSIPHNASNPTKAWSGTVTEIPADLTRWALKASDVR